MSSFHRFPVRRTRAALAAIALLATTASAAVESSCPAPCTTPPRSALFVRETAGVLLAFNGDTAPLEGTLRAGARKSVLRVDASVVVHPNQYLKNFYIEVWLNGRYVDSGIRTTMCDYTKAAICSVSGTFWFDIDALEAAYPGEFVGQPLLVSLRGGNFLSQGVGLPYEASFSAEVVKKK